MVSLCEIAEGRWDKKGGHEVFATDLTGFIVTRVNWTSTNGIRFGQSRFCENLSGLYSPCV